MKSNNTLALLALATGGLMFAASSANASGGKSAEKSAEKTQADASKCSGPNGCDGKDFKCVGANACKGHSDCHTAKSSCKGHNSCKGTGWVKTKSEEECKKLNKKG